MSDLPTETPSARPLAGPADAPADAPRATPDGADPAPATPAPGPRPGADARRPRRRGGRGAGRDRQAASPRPSTPGPDAGPPADTRPARRPHPVLDDLAGRYPRLFGAAPLPLKRGIYEDLQAAHPGTWEPEALKAALATHTRSSRYLSAVASGLRRHDLQGRPVEAVAPEHVHHALLEVFRRRQARPDAEDQRPWLQRRLLQAFEASGLSREDYALRLRGQDEVTGAVLDAALAEAAARSARDEALLRAFESAGQSEAAFAAMYGLAPAEARRTLARARQRRSG